ncbi:acyl-CoA synthetase [Caenimonas aquaedulcis]|uniref:Long-chain fatty acid--CoA ligase n=1 Tax=Caenimonas aquaedulcis TaxID=2793270 RepID=A0A931MGG5_9BURK|nr:long-chain fatty acid--CoA ligase [Caenimonas aquaedulcis]MBG9388023.1 long-chain fatty acid--CoA ligase [Caenimonas aquaedulcis]
MQITQFVRRAARLHPHRDGFRVDGRARTWAQSMGRIPRMAQLLQAQGVAEGDRVAVLAMNSDTYGELLFAIPWAGAVAVPMNIRLAVPENVYTLNHSGASVLVVDESFADAAAELAAQCAGIRSVIYMGNASARSGMVELEAALEGLPGVAESARRGDDLYAIFYTGGTTGYPKGVMLSHANAVSLALSWLAALPPGEEHIVHMHVGGLFHLSGAAYLWYTTACAGTNVFLPKFEALPVMKAIAAHRVNSTVLIPTMVNMMLSHPDFAQHDLTSVRQCIYGGSPIPEPVLLAAMEKLPGWRFVHAYGMTETAGMATTLPACYHVLEGPLAGKRLSAGRSSAVCEVRITRADGSEADTGEVGEIAIRGPNVMLGYWRDPAATQACLRGGWMHSGDAAYMDADGFIYIVDRIKDMIVTGGENVYSAEVENAIHRHPAVREAAVIGIPDAKWGETVHAVVVLAEGMSLDAQALIAHCRTLIAPYKCPKSVDIRTEPLPKTAAGKITKKPLREPYWRDHARRVH